MAERAIPNIGAVANWYGSNRMLGKAAGEAMGKRSWIGVPFAGGMCEIPYFDARTLLVNDVHRHVINLANVIADPAHGPCLIRKLRRCAFHEDQLAFSQKWCEQIAARLEPPKAVLFGEQIKLDWVLDPVEWAFHYFITSWMARAGDAGTKREFRAGMSVRWEGSGGDSAKRFFNAASGMTEWRRTLRRCQFVCMDFVAFLDKCKDEDGHGIYADAPWPDLGDKYVRPFTVENQRALASRLVSYKVARVVVRFGDHPLIRELYPESQWKWTLFSGRNQANNNKTEVLLVRN